MKILQPSTQIADLFKALSQPVRVEILLAIGAGEACVCHLEATLKLRQAFISQHLMALRQAGILDTRRGGRYIFYSLSEPRLMDLVHQAAEILGLPAENAGSPPSHHGCACPKCEPTALDTLIEVSI